MKRIENKVVRWPQGGMAIYMTRVDAERTRRFVLHISPGQEKHGRVFVADQIRHARRNLAAMVQEGGA